MLLFEDQDGDGVYTAGTDRMLGTATYDGMIAAGGTAGLSVPLSGQVLFRDNLVYAWVDSAGEIAEADETNNTGHSGLGSRRQPGSDWLPVVEWQHEWPGTYGVYGPPTVAALVDTDGDGDVDENDIPAVVVLVHAATQRLAALRGDSGQVIWEITLTVQTRPDFMPAVGDLDGDAGPRYWWPGLPTTRSTPSTTTARSSGRTLPSQPTTGQRAQALPWPIWTATDAVRSSGEPGYSMPTALCAGRIRRTRSRLSTLAAAAAMAGSTALVRWST